MYPPERGRAILSPSKDTFRTHRCIGWGSVSRRLIRHKKSIPAGVAWTALLLSIVWVLMVAESWVPYPSSDFHAKNLIDESKVGRSSQVSFLVAGVLAYFSTKAT